MAFTVVSNSFKDGDYLGKDHILSANFGFGCAGGEEARRFNRLLIEAGLIKGL